MYVVRRQTQGQGFDPITVEWVASLPTSVRTLDTLIRDYVSSGWELVSEELTADGLVIQYKQPAGIFTVTLTLERQ